MAATQRGPGQETGLPGERGPNLASARASAHGGSPASWSLSVPFRINSSHFSPGRNTNLQQGITNSATITKREQGRRREPGRKKPPKRGLIFARPNRINERHFYG